jgi:predicted esterase
MLRDEMHRIARFLLASITLLVAVAPARAQDDESPTRDAVSIQDRAGFVEAVQQIAAGKEREGLAGLAAVLAKFPDDADRYLLHYNAACGHARLGETEPAFRELEEAIGRGYAIAAPQLVNLAADPDLAPLRADPRFAPLLERATKRAEETAAGFEKLIAPFVWLPPRPSHAAGAPLPPPTPMPLIVALHPFGADREAWARANVLPFCEKHGFALLAPGGKQMIAPGRAAWAASAADFVASFRNEQRRVFFALEELRKKAPIDPKRIYVVGAGQGASLGFALALRNPQWARGAVLVGGGYAPSTLHDWVERSAGYGRRLALVHGEDDPLFPIAPLRSFVESLRKTGLAVELFEVKGGHELAPEAMAATLEARIAWIDQAPFEKAGAKAAGQGE